jgi:hypothetical protein
LFPTYEKTNQTKASLLISNGHSSPLLNTDKEDTSGFGLKDTTVVLGSAGISFSSIFLFFNADEEEMSVVKLNKGYQ